MSEDNREKGTLEAPSTETETPEGEQPGSVTEGSQPQPERKLTGEEVAFNSLSGSAQERFRAILRENKELEERLTKQAQDDARRVAYQPPSQTHGLLEKEYDGSGGVPKYDKFEVEDYAKRNGFGTNFRAAFREMYWDELTDQKVASKKKVPYTERPTHQVTEREQPLTMASFRERLRKDPAYYDKLVAEGKLEETIKSLTQES